jgi:hypothetical protein
MVVYAFRSQSQQLSYANHLALIEAPIAKGWCLVHHSVAWSDFPEARLKKMAFVPVVSPKVGVPLQALIVGREVLGVQTHYIGRRTFPCLGTPHLCEGCIQLIRRRWKGFLGIWVSGWSRYAIADITINAVRTCPDLVKKGFRLQGKTLRLERIGKKVNGPVTAELGSLPFPDDQVHKDFELKPHLYQMWFGDEAYPESEVSA